MQLLFAQLEQERDVERLDADRGVLLVEVGYVEHFEHERYDRYEHVGRVGQVDQRVDTVKAQRVVARRWYQSYKLHDSYGKKLNRCLRNYVGNGKCVCVT